MSQINDTTRCDGCGVEIPLSPIVIGRRHYCCQDCASGLYCDCAKQIEFEDNEPGKPVNYFNIDMFV